MAVLAMASSVNVQGHCPDSAIVPEMRRRWIVSGSVDVNDWIYWIVAGLGLLSLEALLPGVFMMWLGLAACGAGVLALLLDLDFDTEVVVFAVCTVISLVIGLRMRRPGLVVHTEREGLVGRRATALVFRGRDGRVRLGESDWPARVPADTQPPDPGTRMRVSKVDGVVLIVRPDS
jgi:membrane protein implicated in regulation of membrane protease activity